MNRQREDVTKVAAESEVKRLMDLDTTPWYKKKNLRQLYVFLIPAVLGVEMTSGYDGSILNGLQAVGPWIKHFNNPQGAILGLITAAFSIGACIALPIVPYTNDKVGRKHSITIGSLIIMIGAIIQTISPNIACFLVARLLLGMGIPFCISGASQLIAELVYPKHASVFDSNQVINGLFNESWYAGAIIAAGCTLGTFNRPDNWAWRIPSLVQIAPSLLQLSTIWFIPESPRWLMSKDRHEEAKQILIKYHGEGIETDFVKAEYEEIQHRIRLEMDASSRKWVELVQTPGNRKRVLIAICVGTFSQWSGNGLVSYYLAKVLNTVGITDKRVQNQINLGLTCTNLVTGICGAFLTNHMKRRTQYLIAFGGMLIFFSCQTAASGVYAQTKSQQAGGAVVAMIFIYYCAYTIMHPLTYVYMTEVSPFVHRAKIITLTQFFSRGSSSFNQFVNPIGLAALAWKYYLVYVAWLVVELLIVYFLYPETKGPTLEELADLFERDDPLTGGKLKGKSFDDDEAADTEELGMYKKPATYVESAELKR